jgi:peptidyl-prolyl cis-trans isomerase C
MRVPFGPLARLPAARRAGTLSWSAACLGAVSMGAVSLGAISLGAVSLGAAGWPIAAHAAAPTAPAAAKPAPAATPAAAADPVVATVDGRPIHLSDVQKAAAGLPPNLRNLPPTTLYPMLLTRLIDGRALVIAARQQNLQDTPQVKAQIADATDQILQNALLRKEITPQISPSALHDLFEKTMAGKPGAEEVHARHILVPTKQEAEKIIAQLNKGADFATLAKKYSKDPGASDGGDLGFFTKKQMVPAFADAAFALKPGQYTKAPVHTQFGWHVIEVLARRQAPPQTFAEAEPALRQKVLRDAIEKTVKAARAGVKVHMFPAAMPSAAPAAPSGASPAPAAPAAK